jgi:hypothetical protein
MNQKMLLTENHRFAYTIYRSNIHKFTDKKRGTSSETN